jgi:hypothetical protein
MAANMLVQLWQQPQHNNGKYLGAMGALGDNANSTMAKMPAQQGQLMPVLHQ